MNLTIARACLTSQSDYLAHGEWLREAVEGAGRIIFYPIYYCELNWIEMVWAHLKAYQRRHWTFRFNDLEVKLPLVIIDEIAPCLAKNPTIRLSIYVRLLRRSCRTLLDYTMKRYEGHRCIPKGAQEQMSWVRLSTRGISRRGEGLELGILLLLIV